MKKIVSLAAGFALVMGMSTAAQAQVCNVAAAPGNCTVTHNVSATAPAILRLTLGGLTTVLTNPLEADFDDVDGVSDLNALNVAVKSNKAASATIHTAAANWTGPVGTTKSVGDLRWNIDGSTTWNTISSTPATVVASGKGNRDEDVSWNTLWHLATDEPGAYDLDVVFTLVVP